MVLRRWGREAKKFGFINWVDKVNWPPQRGWKQTFRALALRQSESKFTLSTQLINPKFCVCGTLFGVTVLVPLQFKKLVSVFIIITEFWGNALCFISMKIAVKFSVRVSFQICDKAVHTMVLELQAEDVKWILERRTKHYQFIMVFARHEGKLENKVTQFFSSCSPFLSLPSVARWRIREDTREMLDKLLNGTTESRFARLGCYKFYLENNNCLITGYTSLKMCPFASRLTLTDE